MFIDIDEAREAICCYYDVDLLTDEMWQEVDEIVQGDWERRGYEQTADDVAEFYDTYCMVLDGAVGYVLNKHGFRSY